MNTVRLRSIAEKLGVSVSTVSRVLNDKPGISQTTRDLVLKEMKQLTSHEKAGAVKPADGAKKFIGIIGRKRSKQIDSIYFHHSVSTFESVFSTNGYAALTINAYEKGNEQALSYEQLMPDDCAGYILRGQSLSLQFIMEVMSLGKPIVFLENKLDQHQVDSVICNDYEAAVHTTSYLIQRGHKSIVHITGPQHWYNNRERERGYRDTMKAENLEPQVISMEDTTIQTGEAALHTIRAESIECSAVFAVNDAMAIGLMNYARQSGVSIPKELAVIGFDDIPWSSLFQPSLTTSRIHIDNMGEMAALRIMQRIADPDAPPVEIKIPVEFIERESV